MTIIDEVVEHLRDAGVRLDRALTEADVRRLEQRYGFAFAPDHRELLRTALPLGDRWMNWRHATPAKVRERLDAALTASRDGDPGPDVMLVPLYGDHFLGASPTPSDGPVYAVLYGAVARHADDLLHYVRTEFP